MIFFKESKEKDILMYYETNIILEIKFMLILYIQLFWKYRRIIFTKYILSLNNLFEFLKIL